jgi:hypothetical protein
MAHFGRIRPEFAALSARIKASVLGENLFAWGSAPLRISLAPFVRQADARNPVTSNTERRFALAPPGTPGPRRPQLPFRQKAASQGIRCCGRDFAARFMSGVASAADTPRAAAAISATFAPRFLPSPNWPGALPPRSPSGLPFHLKPLRNLGRTNPVGHHNCPAIQALFEKRFGQE